MEKNMYRCPIRYYSIVTVPKDFISQETVIPPGKTEMTEEEKENTFRDIENREKEKSTYATVVNSLTPYAFVLIETETGTPYWQYLDLAGSLQKIRFTDEPSYAEAEKNHLSQRRLHVPPGLYLSAKKIKNKSPLSRVLFYCRKSCIR